MTEPLKIHITDFDTDANDEYIDIRQHKVDEFSRIVAAARDAFYWKMIANGWLPSQGWRIGERINIDNPLRMTVDHYAIPPRIKPTPSI